jgi:hypothetical protein
MSILDKAKETAQGLVGTVKDRLGGASTEADSVPSQAIDEAPENDKPSTIPSDGAVTPADVAQTVNDPELAHPEPNTEQQES